MKKLFVTLAVLTTLTSLTSCTQNEMAKNYGGTMDYNLPRNEKLVNVTWKEDHLWILTKPMKSSDTVETYIFHEKSSLGFMEGTINIKESK